MSTSEQIDQLGRPGRTDRRTALRGMAMRTAMHTGNTARLSELTGRPLTELHAP